MDLLGAVLGTLVLVAFLNSEAAAVYVADAVFAFEQRLEERRWEHVD